MTDKEIAEFWDTHSFIDYWDEMEEVEMAFERPSLEIVSIRMEKEDLDLSSGWQSTWGVGYSTLLRVWIKEKLQELKGVKEG